MTKEEMLDSLRMYRDWSNGSEDDEGNDYYDEDFTLSIHELIRLIEKEEEMECGLTTPVSTTTCMWTNYITSNSLAPLQVATEYKTQKKDVSPMCYTQNTQTDEMKQRSYLKERLNDTFYVIQQDLREQFHLTPNQPKTAAEAVERIKAGQYRIDEDAYYNGWTGGLNWNVEKPDNNGFQKAVTALNDDLSDATDEVVVGPIDKGLEVLKNFKDWKYAN